MKRPFWGGFYKARATFIYDEKSEEIGIKNNSDLVKIKSKKYMVFYNADRLRSSHSNIYCYYFNLYFFNMEVKSKKKKWVKKWIEYKVCSDESLETISKKHRIHWEIIVEVNKIKPPYVIKEGDVIKVPPQRK